MLPSSNPGRRSLSLHPDPRRHRSPSSISPTALCSCSDQKLKGEVTYELKDPAYCYAIVNAPKDVCSLGADLTKWLSEVENCKVRKIDAMFNAVVFVVKECDKTLGCHDCQHTPCLQRKILEYFNADDDSGVPNKMGQSRIYICLRIGG